ncbi:MAG TPA: amino acid adenylation domain-containing protein [Polyangiaceae bacterium]|jgi:amino acid adenylation domain-containing protein|nr:amino acid adenylation domain-containing protein [Polyangiaceae bacterium]
MVVHIGAELAAAAPPPPPLARFVQIPTDTERSPGANFEAAWSEWWEVDLAPAAPGSIHQGELVAALAALFHRYTQQACVALDVFVIDASGSSRLDLDAAIAGESPVASITEAVRARLAENTANRASHVGEKRASSNIAVSIVMAEGGIADAFDQAVCLEPVQYGYDLHFVVRQSGDLTLFGFAYNARLLRPSTIARMCESYLAILAGVRREPSTPVERLPVLSGGQVRALTVEQDSGASPSPLGPVHQRFEAHAKSQPTAPAASFQGRSITYGELDARSNQLAHHLVTLGVGPEVAVAVCVKPSLEVLVALLAIWKAGGVYFPLDPTHPPALIGRMVSEARPRLVLTTSTLAGLTRGVTQFCFDSEFGMLAGHPIVAPAHRARLGDAAYLFYTSGTTGTSKGVVSTQGNLAQYIFSAGQKYGFAASDVFASLARFTFSISLFELVSPLCCGASLRILDRDEVLAPERLLRALEEVTVLHAGPSLLGSLFRYLRATPAANQVLPRMRHASSGGDMVSPSVMEEMKRVFPGAELFVIYGCTEVSCMGTTFPIPREAKVGRTLVGKAFPDVTVRVLDPNGGLVPFGVVGEIAFAGKGIARGYLERPELTAERFVAIDGRRFYRTGDMGRLHQDGNVEILGRRDFQVQVRGIRIELAGIEKTALELGLAAQCAVVAKPVDEGDLRLVAFVVKPAGGGLASFRRALAAELPDYMLPHHLVVLESMPLTANGKLDRNQLKDMPLEKHPWARRPVSPADERQRRIAEAFAGVLGLALGQIGLEDGFFDLGGDSLLGVYALQEIERTTGVRIAPHALFEGGTVATLARYAEDAPEAESRPILLNGSSSAPPLFMISGIHIYRELARRLEGHCSAYGVFVRREVGAFDREGGSPSVEDLARDYVAIIRAQQPSGPYRLLGYSFAGIVAFEVAQQLRAAGEEVRFLGLVDAFLPEWTLGWRFRVSQMARLVSTSPRDLATFIGRRWRETRDPTYAELGLYHGDVKIGPLEERRFAINGEAAASYLPRMRPFAGNVTLVLSGGRLRKDPLKSANGGWRRHVPSLDLHTVDADHFPLIRTDPHVSVTARIVARGIQLAGR